jgi:hypothetical protein
VFALADDALIVFFVCRRHYDVVIIHFNSHGVARAMRCMLCSDLCDQAPIEKAGHDRHCFTARIQNENPADLWRGFIRHHAGYFITELAFRSRDFSRRVAFSRRTAFQALRGLVSDKAGKTTRWSNFHEEPSCIRLRQPQKNEYPVRGHPA